MKVEKLAAFAEIVSSVAIVVTLGYLAIQTQQNTIAIQSTVRQAMLSEDRELISDMIDHPIFMLGWYDPETLSEQQQVQLSSWLISFLRIRENHWLQYENGVIDERTWLTYRQPLRRILSFENSRSWWRNRSEQGEFDQSFVNNVNKFLLDTPIRAVSSVSDVTGF